MGMGAVQTEWNGLQFNFEVDYEELNPWTDLRTGSYIAEVQVPGLNARANEMQGATITGLDSLVLPPQVCDGLRESPVPNPYLSQGDAPQAHSHYSHTALTYGLFPNSKKWDPHDGSHLADMAEFEPVDAWKLGKNDLESMFVDYF